jgi:DnaK suppressor protein
MDDQRAQALLRAERRRVEELLRVMAAEKVADRAGSDEPEDSGDEAERLNEQGTQALISDELHERLAALDRAQRRLEEGTFGLSTRSGRPIPDDRLEADPAAELTVEEAEVTRR